MLIRNLFVLSGFLLGAGLVAGGPEEVRIRLTAVNFHQDSVTFPPSIHQIESDGHLLYLRSPASTEIAVMDPDGVIFQSIGGTGDHPSEFGHHGVYAMALDGDHLWAIDNDRKWMRHFQGGVLVGYFTPEPGFRETGSLDSHAFAATADRVILPAGGGRGYMADVYDADGEVIDRIGDMPPMVQDLAERVYVINDAMWLRDGEGWISVHIFAPIVTRYAKDFSIIDRFDLASPVINKLMEGVFGFDREYPSTPRPLFSDAKLHDGALYVMVAGKLNRVDLKKREITRVYAFYGEGEGFKDVTADHVTLYHCAFLNDGTLFLVHPAMMWGGDVWRARLTLDAN